jgi:hypothetical protein
MSPLAFQRGRGFYVVRFFGAAAAVAVALVLAGGASAANSQPVSFTDPAGDSGTAADITKVDVQNDDAGQYTFTVTFGTAYSATAAFTIFFDTDQNAATGDPTWDGADYALIDDHSTHSVGLLKWNGTDWDDAPSDSTASVTVAPDSLSLTLSINRSDLGNGAGFNFILFSLEGDGSTGHYDDAPSGSGHFNYTLQPTLSLKLAAAAQSGVKAGHVWTTDLAVLRTDTNQVLGPEGTLACIASSGHTKLKVVLHAFVSAGGSKGSAAVCSFSVPRTLKGKKLHATETVTYEGQTVTHSFTTTVK